MLERQSKLEGSELARELREIADVVRRGEPARLRSPSTSDQAELRWALHGLLEAVEAREQEHRAKAANGEQVMLAFEELARDQAAELARQNEELRRQNEELRVASRHKTEFVTTVSHELRSPLNSVIGFSEMLLQGYAGRLSGEQGEYVGDIHRAGRHLLRLIDDILDLAKVEAGRMEFQRLVFDLSVPVREAEEIARGMALKKGQTLRLESQGFVPCVGDLHRVRQVVLNLLSNAVKFTPEGGEIVVRVERSETHAAVHVKDSGIGISPEHHHFVFEAFRQVDAGDKRIHQGTGLGLALVRRFTEQMGGSVALESRSGEGATFSILLPAADGQARGTP